MTNPLITEARRLRAAADEMKLVRFAYFASIAALAYLWVVRGGWF